MPRAVSFSKATSNKGSFISHLCDADLKLTIPKERLNKMKRSVQLVDSDSDDSTILTPNLRMKLAESYGEAAVKKLENQRPATTINQPAKPEAPAGYVQLSEKDLFFAKLQIKASHGIEYAKYLELR